MLIMNEEHKSLQLLSCISRLGYITEAALSQQGNYAKLLSTFQTRMFSLLLI
jgi:hypothetical protein